MPHHSRGYQSAVATPLAVFPGWPCDGELGPQFPSVARRDVLGQFKQHRRLHAWHPFSLGAVRAKAKLVALPTER